MSSTTLPPISNRPHSWPPLRSRPFGNNNSRSMDDDPFAFFISPDADPDILTDEYLGAGISSTKRSRSLSPFRTRKRSSASGTAFSNTAIAKLKRWIDRMEKRYRHSPHGRPTKTGAISSETPLTVPSAYLSRSPIARGRKEGRLGENLRRRRNVRSHSARPRVWREPGADIWSVAEEEQEDVGLGIMF
ncbi:hypothetical protein MMC06_004640 [Schaereria dolodes]|nr:hypothetical protein [Schaereria dolodes]